QRLDPSTPAHRSSCQHPKSHAGLSTETLISGKPKRSRFNFGYFSETKRALWKKAALGRTNEAIEGRPSYRPSSALMSCATCLSV
ncbi:hypothetical protein, partial [Mesorhizobium sp.]|uniref:hypothetical protein n=1 Tax=Mesorhizobium sp. TaxID=1871066 RepID=UPI00257B7085